MNTLFTIIHYLIRLIMATIGFGLFVVLEVYVINAADMILIEKGYNFSIVLWGVFSILFILQIVKFFVSFVKKIILDIWYTIF